MNSNLTNLIFVDCEGHGPAPTLNDGVLFEFGAVIYPRPEVKVSKEVFWRPIDL